MEAPQASHRAGRGVVALSAAAAALFAASVATIAVLYATGHEDAIEDNPAGAALSVAAAVGFVGSIVAFAGAVRARSRGDRRGVLWLPLAVFPAIVLFLILGEAFWWE